MEEVLDEIQLCWDNCKLYNSPDSEIYQQALFLEATFDTVGKEILPESWEGIDREAYNKQFDERKEQEGPRKIEEPKAKPKREEADEPKKKKAVPSVKEPSEPEHSIRAAEDSHMDIEAEGPGSAHQPSKEEMDEEGLNEAGVEPIMVNL